MAVPVEMKYPTRQPEFSCILTRHQPAVFPAKVVEFQGNLLSDMDDFFTMMSDMEVIVRDIADEGMSLEFDILGVEPYIVNSLRRSLLSDVPSMAPETIKMMQNSSIFSDDNIGSRLGLIPFKMDARRFKFRPAKNYSDHPDFAAVFQLNIPPRNIFSSTKNSTEKNAKNSQKTANVNVYSGDLKWLRHPSYSKNLPENNLPSSSKNTSENNSSSKNISENNSSKNVSEINSSKNIPEINSSLKNISEINSSLKNISENNFPRPVSDKILLATLLPSQELLLQVHVVKGIGKDHAKFSPVSTVNFRPIPNVKILRPFFDDAAEKLKTCLPKGVVEVEENSEGRKEAVVKNSRLYTSNRRVFFEEFAKNIQIALKENEFIFTVESVGALPSVALVKEALIVLKRRCEYLHIICPKESKFSNIKTEENP